jgi:hypothetical protein
MREEILTQTNVLAWHEKETIDSPPLCVKEHGWWLPKMWKLRRETYLATFILKFQTAPTLSYIVYPLKSVGREREEKMGGGSDRHYFLTGRT